jgi:hypothetical protein
MCRKAHGAAFSANAEVTAADFPVITLTTLDADPGIRSARHVFTDPKASWYSSTER